MKLSLKFKSEYFRANNKAALMRMITAGCVPVKMNTGTYSVNAWKNVHNNNIRVFNLHKYNRKVIQNKNGNNKLIPMYWEAYVYEIPKDVVITCGFHITQNHRNFTAIAYI